MKKLTVYQLLSLALPVQILLVKIISYFPELIEHYYSNGLFPYISVFFRTIYGWIPFSIGDISYAIISVGFIIFSYRFIKNKLKNRKQQFFKLVAYLSLFYFIFHLFWGLNYYRTSLFKTLNIEEKEYTLNELIILTDTLLLKLKQTQLVLVTNDTVKVTIPYSRKALLNKTKLGYDMLAKEYPQYHYTKPSLKPSLFSLPLTYMGFAGYFNPLSSEAQVDILAPKINLPMTCSHELAHQLGFASESETNFIGFLAATKHKDAYFKYSGYLMAIRYSIGSIRYKDSTLAKKYFLKLPKGIHKNIKESDEFWKSYHNQAEPYFKFFYDNYLKANQQKEGIQSYSKMVNLLIAYQKEHEL